MHTTTTASMPRQSGRARRSRRHEDARITARFVQKTISATNIGADLLKPVLREIDSLIAQGVEYIYLIDEIFLPQKDLLAALAERPVKIGVQTRIDLWPEEMIEMLAAAHCVSIEAGVESITESGRDYLDKKCKMSTDDLSSRLIFAKKRIPFVQANLIATGHDDEQEVEDWRQHLAATRSLGKQACSPVPVSGVARLHQTLGSARRPCVGARSRLLSARLFHVQRYPEPAAGSSDSARVTASWGLGSSQNPLGRSVY